MARILGTGSSGYLGRNPGSREAPGILAPERVGCHAHDAIRCSPVPQVGRFVIEGLDETAKPLAAPTDWGFP